MEEFTAPGTDAVNTSLLGYLQSGDLDVGSNFNKNHNSQVLTKTLLMEHLATAIGCAPSDRFDSPRVPSNDKIHDTIKPIVKSADRWPRAMKALGDKLSQRKSSNNAVTEAGLSEGSLPGASPMFTSLSLLSQSRGRLDKAGRLMSEAHVLLIAFMVYWHATVRLPTVR